MSCNIGESWLPAGNLVHSSPTHELGIALELLLYVREGFSNPLLPKGTKASAQNPTAHITFEFEISCADSSCVLYFIEVLRLPYHCFAILDLFNVLLNFTAMKYLGTLYSWDAF